jgi:amidophosphoribosyltransferase
VLFSSLSKPPQVVQIVSPRLYCPDALEYVYFARPESVMDRIAVHQATRQLGLELARCIANDHASHKPSYQIDMVNPVPETSFIAENALAQALNIP